MIRILVVDDHPAVRVGLVGVLRGEPGLVPVAAVESADRAIEEAHRARPDVALVDYSLGEDDDGLLLTWELKQLEAAPKVVVYSAFAGGQLAVAAAVAGADALLDKGEAVERLYETVRGVARGEEALQLSPEVVQRSASRLEPEDHSIFGMRLAGESLSAIASVASEDERELAGRIRSMLGRLSPPADTARPPSGDRTP